MIDDGSSSYEESISMLEALRDQGVDIVCATPHFDALRDDPDNFLEKRERARERLGILPSGMPQILLGAEVMYFLGISRVEKITSLCLEGTKILLIEMPMSKWSDYEVKEIIALMNSGKVKVMLAHVERYLPFSNNSAIERLCDAGVIMQFNASCFKSFGSRRKAIKMLLENEVCAIGSDCHNMGSRSPDMDVALSFIEKKMGKDFIIELDEMQRSLIKKRSN